MASNVVDAPVVAPAVPARAKGTSGLAALTRARRPQLTPEALTELNQLEELLGGRAEIIASLVTAPASDGLTWVIGLLADPERQGQTLAEICAEGRILPTDLLEALIQGKRARSKVYATHLATADTARIVRDVVLKAAPHEDRCYGCKGRGVLPGIVTPEDKDPVERTCETCNGVGTLYYPADEDARKLALELSGLLAKGGAGVAITVNAQQKTLNLVGGGGGMAGDGVGLQEAIDQILYGGAATGDADVDEGPGAVPLILDAEVLPESSRPDDPFAPEAVAVTPTVPIPTAADHATTPSRPVVLAPPGRRPQEPQT